MTARSAAGRRLGPVLARLAPPAAIGTVASWRFGEPARPTRSATARRYAFEALRRAGVDVLVRVPWQVATTVEVLVPSDLGRCLWVAGCFEPNEVAWLAGYLRPGMCFVDVGANIGLYSLVAARLVGAGGLVVAIEPSPRERAALEANLAANELTAVRVRPEAVGDTPGKATLHVADVAHGGQNTLGSTIYPGTEVVGVVEVDVVTLDDVVAGERLDAVDVVKIDVEGAEALVCAGAGGLLADGRPLVLLELQDASLRAMGSSSAELVAQLGRLDYAVVPFDDRTGRLQAAEALDERAASALSSANVVAWPTERLGELA